MSRVEIYRITRSEWDLELKRIGASFGTGHYLDDAFIIDKYYINTNNCEGLLRFSRMREVVLPIVFALLEHIRLSATQQLQISHLIMQKQCKYD